MNILFIVTTLYGGGAERVVSRLSARLCEEHNVYIIVTYPAGNHDGTYPIDPRITVHEMDVPRVRNRILKRIPGIDALRWWKEMKRLKKRWKIDTAISFLTSCNYDNVRSRRKEKVIISIRSILSYTIPKDPGEAGREIDHIRFAAERADHIVCVSRNTAAEQVREYHADPRLVSTIYNPINAADLKERSQKPVTDDAFLSFSSRHPKLLITAGRLTWQKGQRHLIRAFARIRERFPETGLVILGKGELEESLREVIRANGLEEHVLLAGFHPEPFPWYAKADIFVLSSQFEGMPNVCLEAMACGLPVVACDCNSGPRELLAPTTDPALGTTVPEPADYGILTPVCSGDPDLTAEPLQPEETALADSVCLLLDDPALREHYCRQSLARIRDFDTEKILAEWEKLL